MSRLIISAPCYVILHLHILVCFSSTKVMGLDVAMALPDCSDKCGEVKVPYPFTIDHPKCAKHPSFLLNCNRTMSPPTLFYPNYEFFFLNLSLEESTGTIIVQNPMMCHQNGVWFLYNYIHQISGRKLISSSGVPIDLSYPYSVNLANTPFTISYTQNKFTAIGCKMMAFMSNPSGQHLSACVSMCGENLHLTKDSCPAGIGCCQSSIPAGLKNFQVELSTADIRSIGGCGFFMLMDQDSLTEIFSDNRSMLHVSAVQGTTLESHIVVDWVIDSNHTCAQALALAETNGTDPSNYACGPNSVCTDSRNGPGYLCSCKDGFHGNPYLPQGCQDIDECKEPDKYPCHGKYINLPGNYNCQCPLWMHGDGKVGCHGIYFVTFLIGIGITFGIVSLVVILCMLYVNWKKKHYQNLKKMYFKKNGGLLLEKQIFLYHGKLEKSRTFTAEELEKATDNYNESRILGEGGRGTVYKGMLPDGAIVAIKKSGKVEESQTTKFINEMVILPQINHKHVVKLLGYCLETEVPLLVYEFVPNSTLFNHIHDKNEEFPVLKWSDRLRIAKEVAGAVAYMHSALKIPIYHRDIKSSNILLDEKLRAKVSDFGISRLIPPEKTHLTTFVDGTFGYIDPEFVQTRQFTEKSDVYSYGVLLTVLLMGQKPISEVVIKGERGLAAKFLSAMKRNCLEDMLDPLIVDEAEKDELFMVARVAESCVQLIGRERPTMMEVSIALENSGKTKEQLISTRHNQQDCVSEASIECEDNCSDTKTADVVPDDHELEMVALNDHINNTMGE